jgi:hypothetical protein
MDGKNCFDGFHFDQDAIVHKEIETQWLIPDECLVSNLDGLLIDRIQTPQFEFLDKAPLVDGFNETRSFVTVHFDRSADDCLSEARRLEKERMHDSRLCSLCFLL